MRRHPTLGMKGSKPRLPGTKTNGQPASKAEVSRLSHEYLVSRNAMLKAKTFTAELLAAKAREELIQKTLVEKQAAYLLIAMRQKILNLPQTYARRLVGLNDVREDMKVLEGAAHSILNELKDLPGTVTDPHWPESLEEKDEESKTSD